MDIKTLMYNLAKELFPICRSITGKGTRETLKVLKNIVPQMKLFEVPSGTQAFDWTVPKEWEINDAYIKDESDNKIVDFNKNNLHVMSYSTPVDATVTLEEMQPFIYSLQDQPNVVPYVTSYYKERFGFCMSQNQRDSLKTGNYHMHIDSRLFDGSLTYGEILLPGESTQEVFISTYVCHPSMANNELSGPCVAIYLAKWLSEMSMRKYTYRFVFIPETIGSITYLSINHEKMRRDIIAGFNLSCVGDDLAYSYLPSRNGNTLSDRVAINVLNQMHPNYIKYSYLDRGSDERQYNSPDIDLPVCSVMRSKYGEYPEYHTSADDMSFISHEGLYGSYEVYQNIIQALEYNAKYKITCLGEPQLGKRGLYPTESYKGSAQAVKSMMDFIAYSDGTKDLISISATINVPISELIPIVKKLLDANLLKTL